MLNVQRPRPLNYYNPITTRKFSILLLGPSSLNAFSLLAIVQLAANTHTLQACMSPDLWGFN